MKNLWLKFENDILRSLSGQESNKEVKFSFIFNYWNEHN